MATRNVGVKATPTARRAEMIDEGGWTLGQVILWVTTGNFDLVRNTRTKSDFWRYGIYRSENDPNFPKQRDGESYEEIDARQNEYHSARRRAEQPKIIKARSEVLQKLRTGKLMAISKDGREVEVSIWQVIDLFSPDALSFSYRSSLVRTLWPEPRRGKPTDDAVQKLVTEIYAEVGGGPKPKQETVRQEVRSRLPGATHKQINLALGCLPTLSKNPRGRPKKNKTEK